MAELRRQLSDPALRVLEVLLEKAMDGYTVLSRTGLDVGTLAEALRDLKAESLIDMKGDLSPDRVGEAYIWVPPNAKSYANLLLTQLRFK
jgi:hypothetical protein